tara:strand:+ start:411 stop:605 length:195 start_codon:yes stop_codon:yes gene_type:complete
MTFKDRIDNDIKGKRYPINRKKYKDIQSPFSNMLRDLIIICEKEKVFNEIFSANERSSLFNALV